MASSVVNLSLQAKSTPTVNITVNEAGSVSGTGSVSPVIKFVASGEAGPTGAQGIQGTIAGNDVITTSNIQNGAVSTAKLADDSVTADKLGPNSVYGAAIPDLGIDTTKIGNDAVTSAKIADDAVTSAHIAPNAINEELIESGIITRASIAPGTIDSSLIQNYTLVTTDFSLNSVDGTVIVDNPQITGDVSAVNYKARGASPGKFEGPDSDEMHLKFHTDLKFVNTSGSIVGGVDQSGNFTISGTVDGIDIATDVAANTAKVSYPSADSTKVGHLTVTQAVDLDAIESKLDGVEVNATADQTVEEIQDIAGPLVATGGTKTGIAITYDDANGNMDFVVDHDAATNFVAEEHYRWDNDIQSTATINHLNLSSDTPGETEVLVMNDGDAVWGHGEKIHIQVRNDEGSTISAGQPLYSKGEIGGSNRILVGVCDADDSAKMPCIGIAHAEMNTTSTKDNFAVVSGIYNTNISGFTSLAVGDNLYIRNDGSLSQYKPLGSSSKIQNVGIVLKTNGSTCQGLLVSAIGRTNDIPNLNSGTFFMGNSFNASQAVNFLDQVNYALQNQTTTFLRNIASEGDDFTIQSKGEMKFIIDMPDNETGQSFTFHNGGTSGGSTEIANLDESGNLQIDGDLTISGNEIKDDDGTVCITFDSSGNTAVANTLNASVTGNVTGNASTADALTTGNKDIEGTLNIKTTSASASPFISLSQTTTRRAFIQLADSNLGYDNHLRIASEYGPTSIAAASTPGADTDTAYFLVQPGGTFKFGAQDGDATLTTDGSMTFKLDSDDDETAQSFSFRDGGAYGSFTEIANLNQDGDLVIEGDLTVKGNQINGTSSASVLTFGTGVTTLTGSLETSSTIYSNRLWSYGTDGDIEIRSQNDINLIVDGNNNASGELKIKKAGSGGDDDIIVISEAGVMTMYGSQLAQPAISLQQSSQNTTYGPPIFDFFRNSLIVDNADIGRLDFRARDSGGSETIYAQIIGSTEESGAGTEGGKIRFKIASHDAELVDGLIIEDGSVEDEVDVTIGNGISSVTSISGRLDVNGTAGIYSNKLQAFADTDLQISTDKDMYFRIDTDGNTANKFHWEHYQSGAQSYTSLATFDENAELTIISTQDDKPKITINQQSNTVTAAAPQLEFYRQGVSTDNKELGDIVWSGLHQYGSKQTYAQIVGKIEESSVPFQGGQILLQVASHDGEMVSGLKIEDGNAEDEIDVTIANGSSSLTTVAGNLNVTTNIELGHASDTTIARTAAGTASIEGKEIQTYAKHYHFIHSGFLLSFEFSRYIPLNGSLNEQNTSTNTPEYTTFVWPYDGTVSKIWVRSEADAGDTEMKLYKGANGATVGTAMGAVTAACGANTSVEFDMTSVTNSFSQGEAMAVRIDPTNDTDAGYNVTIECIFDLTT